MYEYIYRYLYLTDLKRTSIYAYLYISTCVFLFYKKKPTKLTEKKIALKLKDIFYMWQDLQLYIKINFVINGNLKNN